MLFGVLKDIETGILTGSGMGILNNGLGGWSIYRSCGHDRFAPYCGDVGAGKLDPAGSRETEFDGGMLAREEAPAGASLGE
jgi:hypothetical protein